MHSRLYYIIKYYIRAHVVCYRYILGARKFMTFIPFYTIPGKFWLGVKETCFYNILSPLTRHHVNYRYVIRNKINFGDVLVRKPCNFFNA